MDRKDATKLWPLIKAYAEGGIVIVNGRKVDDPTFSDKPENYNVISEKEWNMTVEETENRSQVPKSFHPKYDELLENGWKFVEARKVENITAVKLSKDYDYIICLIDHHLPIGTLLSCNAEPLTDRNQLSLNTEVIVKTQRDGFRVFQFEYISKDKFAFTGYWSDNPGTCVGYSYVQFEAMIRQQKSIYDGQPYIRPRLKKLEEVI